MRDEVAFKNQILAIKEFLVFHLREDLMKEFKVPARMLAAGLLALYEDLTLEYEAKAHGKKKRIPILIAYNLPVLLLRRQGNRQYFFVPG